MLSDDVFICVCNTIYTGDRCELCGPGYKEHNGECLES